jgi:hypothetical protein
MRRPSAFKKTDLTRATRGILDAGLSVTSVEFKDGGFTIITGKSQEVSHDDETPEDVLKLI